MKTWTKDQFDNTGDQLLNQFSKKTHDPEGYFKKQLNALEQSKQSFFITGKAGTGKSTLLKIFLETTKKNVIALAPTGLAAVTIGGQTIHKFFGFPPQIVDDSHIHTSKKKIYRKIDTILIDEISMVRADLFDAMDKFMRKNGKKKDQPFGGVQLILIGDLFQLPPVVTKQDKPYIDRHYDAPYFFASNAFKELNIQSIILEKVFRQKEASFIEILDKIRHGDVTREDLTSLNDQVDYQYEATEKDIILTGTNRIASAINKFKLEEIPTKVYTYRAVIEGNIKKEQVPAEETLELKKGARVIFIRNDPEGAYFNGTLGTVTDLDHKSVMVRLDDGLHVDVTQTLWENKKYEYDEAIEMLVSATIGTITQYPIKLAWALTIHKSQGQTFDKVFIDLSTGLWDHGQAYVALSRCTTLDGMTLRTPILPSHIKVDQKIVNFLENSQEIE